jgi:[ribosomal protein S5]-alanine N-acetyltransferase
LVTLETARLYIRNFRPDDWEALLRLIVQYQASAMAAYDQPWPTSAEEIRGVAAWFAAGDSYLAVCLKETGRFIGFVALNPEPGEAGPQFNLGYVFDADYHGQGYAGEACRAVLRYAFDQLGALSIVSGTAAANLPSRRLLERLGFQKTDEAATSFRKNADGTPIEFLGYAYALSRQDWISASQAGRT